MTTRARAQRSNDHGGERDSVGDVGTNGAAMAPPLYGVSWVDEQPVQARPMAPAPGARNERAAPPAAGQSLDDALAGMRTMPGKEVLPEMTAASIGIGEEPEYVSYVMNTYDGAYWLQPLKDADQWISFIYGAPNGTAITDDQAKRLDSFVEAAPDATTAKQVFNKVYPSLYDKSVDPSVTTVPWGLEDIKRLYKGLSHHVPVDHVHTIVNGFYLGTNHNLAFWSGDRVVMLGSPATLAAGKDKQAYLKEWDHAALHEIGHGVGAKTDGYKFAKDHGNWKLDHDVEEWSKNLFDPKIIWPFDNAADLGGDSRKYMANKIGGKDPGLTDKRTSTIEKYLKLYFVNQSLYQYYASKVLQGKEGYLVARDALEDNWNASGGRVYVWLSRVNGGSYCSYDETLYDNKVTDYSLSSPEEWFAEVYTHYYKHDKSGDGLDKETKDKLDELDERSWDPAAASGKGALVDPNAEDAWAFLSLIGWDFT